MRRLARTRIHMLASVTTLLATAPLVLGNAMADSPVPTRWPVDHVVVIFQENVTFDHYFGTYPQAANAAGEPAFFPSPNTPAVNGLTPALLNNNPNAANPKRLDRSQAVTCDQDHGYTDEQKAFDSGLMDKFVEFVSGGSCTDKSIVMDYYDGNTVTALWNYAQHFAMSDNFYTTGFGPSTPGALNLISGQTHGTPAANNSGNVIDGTVIGDPRPLYDDCSPANSLKISMSGTHVGDLLNAQNVTWGWFAGGFTPSNVTPAGTAVCGTSHQNVAGMSVTDYIPHHEPFQYFQSSANPHHLPPTSVAMIGKTDQANHQYDLQDFWRAVNAGNMPAVSYLKARAFQDGHAGYSDPLDEQQFLVETLNALQQRPEWSRTAVFITYDDTDGWYDHVMPPIFSQSSTAADALTAPGMCGVAKAGTFPARCGYGGRVPLLAISPLAKRNYVDHTVTDQTSILRFIEDNWFLGRIGNQSFDALAGSLEGLFQFHQVDQGQNTSPFILNSATGQPTSNQNNQN
jgi:phospholipase C